MTRATLIQAREGDQRALNQVIKEFDPLIYHITHQRTVRSGYFDDYMQAGRIGLLEAVSKISDKSNYKFSSFAGKFIRHEMLLLSCQIRGQSPKEYQVLNKYYRHMRNMEKELQMEVDMIDVMDDMDLYPFERDIIKSYVRAQEVSVDISDLVERKIEKEINDNELNILQDGKKKMLNEMIARLTDRQTDIVKKHYYQDMSSKRIADELGTSQGYILKEIHKIRAKLLKDWPNQLFETAFNSDLFFDPTHVFHREEWKSLDESKYSVSNYGRVLTYHKNYKKFMIRKPSIESRKYRYQLVFGNAMMKATPAQLIVKYFELDELPTFYERS